jgi:hypothetical protein
MKRRLKLISSGADKLIVVRNVVPAGSNFISTMTNNQDVTGDNTGF